MPQALFLFTQPVSRSSQYSELDFFKKKMATTLRINRKKSLWFAIKRQNFTNVLKQVAYTTYERAPHKQIVRQRVTGSLLPSYRKFNKDYVVDNNYASRRTTFSLSKSFLKKNNNKDSVFSFFFRNLIYKLKFYFFKSFKGRQQKLLPKMGTRKVVTNPRHLVGLNKRLGLLGLVRRKLITLKNVNLKLLFNYNLNKLNRNKDLKALLSLNKRRLFVKANPQARILFKSKFFFLPGQEQPLVPKFRKKRAARRSRGVLLKPYRILQKHHLLSLKLRSQSFAPHFTKKLRFLKKKYARSLFLISKNYDNYFLLDKGKRSRPGDAAYGKKNMLTQSRFQRKMDFFAKAQSDYCTRRLTLYNRTLNNLKINKKYFVKQHNTSHDLERLFSAISHAKRKQAPVPFVLVKARTNLNKFLFRLGSENVLALCRFANTEFKLRTLRLLNDGRDTSFATLKFLCKVKNALNKFKPTHLNRPSPHNADVKLLSHNSKNLLAKNPTQRLLVKEKKVLKVKKHRLSLNKKNIKPVLFLRDLPGYKHVFSHAAFKYQRLQLDGGVKAPAGQVRNFFGLKISPRQQARPFKALRRKLSIVKRF